MPADVMAIDAYKYAVLDICKPKSSFLSVFILANLLNVLNHESEVANN